MKSPRVTLGILLLHYLFVFHRFRIPDVTDGTSNLITGPMTHIREISKGLGIPEYLKILGGWKEV